MTWLPATAPGQTPLDRVFGLLPAAYERFRVLYGGLWNADVIDPRVIELCRLRIASLLGCDAERCLRYADARRAGLSEDIVAALSQWPTSPLFTPAERACLSFAEQYVLDPHGVGDEHFTALREHLSAPGIATLTLAIAVFDALSRFRIALEVESMGDQPVLVPGPGTAPESLP